jgi:type II secretory pathway component PulF
MDAPTSRPSGVITLLMLLAHAVVAVALLYTLVVVVPSYDRTFRDFGLKLSALTETVIGLSRGATSIWFLLPIVIVLVLMVDAAVLYLLRRSDGTRWVSWCWVLVWLVLALASGVIMLLAVWLPYRKLVEGLSK